MNEEKRKRSNKLKNKMKDIDVGFCNLRMLDCHRHFDINLMNVSEAVRMIFIDILDLSIIVISLLINHDVLAPNSHSCTSYLSRQR